MTKDEAGFINVFDGYQTNVCEEYCFPAREDAAFFRRHDSRNDFTRPAYLIVARPKPKKSSTGDAP